MSYEDEKNGGTQYAVLQPSRDVEAMAEYEKEDEKMKKSIRILRFLSRCSTVILNLFIIISMSYSLAKYYLTKNHLINGTVHPWATPTKLWPTYMLLAIAILTFFANLITLCAYACGVGASNKVSTVMSVIRYSLLVVHVVVWAVVAGAFKMASNGSDLWGYSCGSTSDAIQAEVQSYLNFGKLCTIQTGSWYVSIIEAIVYFLTFVTTILMTRRYNKQKQMKQLRESMMSSKPMENVNG